MPTKLVNNLTGFVYIYNKNRGLCIDFKHILWFIDIILSILYFCA